MSARILVIGGAGLIGGAATRALLRSGHDVCVLSRGTLAVPAGASTLTARRRDAASMAAALSGESFDVVVDLLAYTGEDVRGLFDVPRFRMGRVFMISTGQVYLVAAERHPPFVESDSRLPAMPEPEAGTRAHANWVYGTRKREAEAALRSCAERFGIAATALRLPVVQGANDTTRRLWAYVQRILDGGPILLPGGGEHPLRFVWSEDVARSLVTLVSQPPPPEFAYNLAQPDELTLSELLASAAGVLGAEARTVGCSWEQAEAAGLDDLLSPFSGPWCSRPDPSLAGRDWGFAGTPSHVWLPQVVRAHLAEPAPAPHAGYALRERERALAATLAGGPGG